MAYVGPWGTFIHIPKTGGQWVRRVLRASITGTEDGGVHALPHENTPDKQFCFTFVRDPAYWLRSYWGHRMGDAVPGEPFRFTTNNGNLWNDLNRFTFPHMSEHFETFARNIALHLPGIVGWFYHYYTAPDVRWYHSEDAAQWLDVIYPPCVPASHDPLNTYETRMKKKPPSISDVLYRIIYKAEYDTYKKYDYPLERR